MGVSGPSLLIESTDSIIIVHAYLMSTVVLRIEVYVCIYSNMCVCNTTLWSQDTFCSQPLSFLLSKVSVGFLQYL